MTPITAPVCPVHHVDATLVADRAVYGGRGFGGFVWRCPVDGCDYRVGAHPDGRPKGTLANADLRQWRRRAHVAFDTHWPRYFNRRRDAYVWLAQQLDRDVVHLGELDAVGCARVCAVVEREQYLERRRLQTPQVTP